MMILQLISEDENVIHDIANFLLSEKLLANAMITDNVIFKQKDEHGTIVTSKQYTLKGISKSLLFSAINKKLRAKYHDKMPLLYSEPIILIDSEQIEEILGKLVSV